MSLHSIKTYVCTYVRIYVNNQLKRSHCLYILPVGTALLTLDDFNTYLSNGAQVQFRLDCFFLL